MQDDLLTIKNITAILLLQRDYSEGSVSVGKNGVVEIDYRICKKDQKSLMKSVWTAMSVLQAAGAKKIMTLSNVPVEVTARKGEDRVNMEVSERS